MRTFWRTVSPERKAESFSLYSNVSFGATEGLYECFFYVIFYFEVLFLLLNDTVLFRYVASVRIVIANKS
jgi:hypothetical protein